MVPIRLLGALAWLAAVGAVFGANSTAFSSVNRRPANKTIASLSQAARRLHGSMFVRSPSVFCPAYAYLLRLVALDKQGRLPRQPSGNSSLNQALVNTLAILANEERASFAALFKERLAPTAANDFKRTILELELGAGPGSGADVGADGAWRDLVECLSLVAAHDARSRLFLSAHKRLNRLPAGRQPAGSSSSTGNNTNSTGSPPDSGLIARGTVSNLRQQLETAIDRQRPFVSASDFRAASEFLDAANEQFFQGAPAPKARSRSKSPPAATPASQSNSPRQLHEQDTASRLVDELEHRLNQLLGPEAASNSSQAAVAAANSSEPLLDDVSIDWVRDFVNRWRYLESYSELAQGAQLPAPLEARLTQLLASERNRALFEWLLASVHNYEEVVAIVLDQLYKGHESGESPDSESTRRPLERLCTLLDLIHPKIDTNWIARRPTQHGYEFQFNPVCRDSSLTLPLNLTTTGAPQVGAADADHDQHAATSQVCAELSCQRRLADKLAPRLAKLVALKELFEGDSWFSGDGMRLVGVDKLRDFVQVWHSLQGYLDSKELSAASPIGDFLANPRNKQLFERLKMDIARYDELSLLADQVQEAWRRNSRHPEQVREPLERIGTLLDSIDPMIDVSWIERSSSEGGGKSYVFKNWLRNKRPNTSTTAAPTATPADLAPKFQSEPLAVPNDDDGLEQEAALKADAALNDLATLKERLENGTPVKNEQVFEFLNNWQRLREYMNASDLPREQANRILVFITDPANRRLYWDLSRVARNESQRAWAP